jgi:hypothetical protein
VKCVVAWTPAARKCVSGWKPAALKAVVAGAVSATMMTKRMTIVAVVAVVA